MSYPHVGEVRLFAGNYAPVGWEFCHGQMLSISRYDALYVLIGTTYGGDGMVTFRLPDLRGRVPIHHGSPPDGTPRQVGTSGGQEVVTLRQEQMPPHTHAVRASATTATSRTAVGNAPAALPSGRAYSTDEAGEVIAQSSPAGGDHPHENRQPFTVINYIIATTGAFPSRA